MKLILTLLLLATVNFSYAQPHGFRNGLIITQSNDTIYCLVPIASSFGKQVATKKFEDSYEKYIPISQIKYLATETNVYENIGYLKKGKEVHKLMWLAVEGELNLYLELEIVIANTKFTSGGYVSTMDKPNLTYVIKRNDSTFLIEEKKFIEAIMPLIKEDEELSNKISSGEIKYDDIESLIKAYNRNRELTRLDREKQSGFVAATELILKDQESRATLEEDCDGKLFTKVDRLPAIRDGEQSLADSLGRYFKNKNYKVNGKAVFSFVVTNYAKVVGIEKVSGELSEENKFIEALVAYSGVWIPALENSRYVCTVVHLEVGFEENQMMIKVIK